RGGIVIGLRPLPATVETPVAVTFNQPIPGERFDHRPKPIPDSAPPAVVLQRDMRIRSAIFGALCKVPFAVLGVVLCLARLHFGPRPILGHSLTDGLAVLCPICGLVRSNSRAVCLVVRFRARFTVGVSAVL